MRLGKRKQMKRNIQEIEEFQPSFAPRVRKDDRLSMLAKGL